MPENFKSDQIIKLIPNKFVLLWNIIIVAIIIAIVTFLFFLPVSRYTSVTITVVNLSDNSQYAYCKLAESMYKHIEVNSLKMICYYRDNIMLTAEYIPDKISTCYDNNKHEYILTFKIDSLTLDMQYPINEYKGVIKMKNMTWGDLIFKTK